MDFSEALNLLRRGARLYRGNWNGRGMWISVQRPDLNSKMTLPYIYMRTVQGHMVPWVASHTDLLSEDWYVTPVDD